MCCHVFCLLLFYFGVVCFARRGDPIKRLEYLCLTPTDEERCEIIQYVGGNLLSIPVLFNAAIDRALRCQDLPDFGSV